MEKVKKGDFVEIEFTGVANGEVFDTTSEEEAKKIGLKEAKPVIISVGNKMLLNGFDKNIEGKEIGKEYCVTIPPEEAFGKRNPAMIRTVPVRLFYEKKINPYAGMIVQMDGRIAKILSVSGGRVNVDFNNPLAGKNVTYRYVIKRKVEDEKEKINSLQDFFFKERFNFDINGKEVVFKDEKIDEGMKNLLEFFLQRFKEILGMEFKIEKGNEK